MRLIIDDPLTQKQQDAMCYLIHRFIGYPFDIRFKYVSEFPACKFEEFVSLLNG